MALIPLRRAPAADPAPGPTSPVRAAVAVWAAAAGTQRAKRRPALPVSFRVR